MICIKVVNFIKRLLLGILIALFLTVPTLAKSQFDNLKIYQRLVLENQLKFENLKSQPKIEQGKILTGEEVEAIAKQVTVVIAEGLQKDDIENKRQGILSGSGVILAKLGKTYFVATNSHVIHAIDVNYGIRTYDKNVHKVDGENTKSNIHVFGTIVNQKVIKGVDLAIVEFQSNKDYPVATLEINPVTAGDKVFVSGWPSPKNLTGAMQRRTKIGKLLEIKVPPELGGYSFSYDCETEKGMSGGPVFNNRGQVVGIHAAGGDVVNGKIEYLGILIEYLKSYTRKAQQQINAPKTFAFKNFAFNFLPPSSSMITTGMKLNESVDKIDNFFKTFSLNNFQTSSTRDCPTGVLLGPDEDCK